MSKQLQAPAEVLRRLWFGPEWLSCTEAADVVGIGTKSMREVQVTKGIVRAKRTDLDHILILRDDVWYVYRVRKDALERHQRPEYQTLPEREVFPPSCTGMSGEALTTWAQQCGRNDLLMSTLAAPEFLTYKSTRGDMPVQEFLSLETLAGRISQLEGAVQSLYIVKGSDPAWSALSDENCAELATQAAAACSSSDPDFDYWNRVFLRLCEDHIAQLAQWGRDHPRELAALADPPWRTAYTILLELSRHNHAYAAGLPGAGVVGSAHARVLERCARAQAHVHQLCRLQAASDLLLERGPRGYLPVPMTHLDRYFMRYLGY